MHRRGATSRARRPVAQRVVLLLLGVALGTPPGTGIAADAGEGEASTAARPTALVGPRIEPAWEAALAREQQAMELRRTDPALAGDALLRSAETWSELVGRGSDPAAAYWRAARCYWLSGEQLPIDDKRERLRRFTLAEAAASHGIEANPSCAECMLWKFTSLGRVATSRGVLRSLGAVPEMAELLERGIALHPTYADNENNSTLGNLYYGSAIFYRVLPDWFWLRWFLGVRGDKERALEDARMALSLHPNRLDYRVELGAQLVCLGSERHEERREREGMEILRRATTRPAETEEDARQISAARLMIEMPRKACGFTGDDWLELDAKDVRGS